MILLKVNVNPSWETRFFQAGIPLRRPDEGALEMKHIIQALEAGRNPYAIRSEIADSGIPVFGKGGAQDVSVNGLFAELRNQGYLPTGIHIRTRADKKFNVLVLPFIRIGGENSAIAITSSAVMRLVEQFLRTSWGFVHVWDNPPQPGTQTVVHTVNLSHRDVDRIPKKTLHFRQGEWSAIPI